MSERDDDRTARQISRGKRRRAGDRSAELARALMKLAAPAVKRLQLDPELRDVVDRARAVTSPIARRRAERSLAGELRRHDLAGIADRLAKLHESDSSATRLFHLAEHWRARLIAESAAVAEFPGGADDAELPRLIDAARRERDTGRPPGAARKLFRHVYDALKAQQAPPPDPDLEDDLANDDDDDGDDDA